jgi:hypothetical protein
VNALAAPLAVVLSVGVVATAALSPAPNGGPGGAPGLTPGPTVSTLPALLARVDDLHRRRDDRLAWAEEQHLMQSALARAASDYGVLWRAARLYFWASDDPGLPTDQRSRWGKDGWDLAERAIAANPNDVAGYYWAAVCMGNYAMGLGVMRALSQGMEGKFRDRLGRATSLNAAYENGGVETAWGRFFDKLPWPKRDRKKAEEHLRRAIEINPAALRARVYLASSFVDSDRAPEAKRLLDEVTAAPVGRYDAPEERRAKALASGVLQNVYAKLK